MTLLLAVLLAVTAQADPIRPLALVAGQADTLVVADLVPTGSAAFASTDAVAVEPHGDRLVFTPDLSAEGLHLIPFEVDGAAYALPTRVTVRTPHTFSYAAEAGEVFVFGQFNDWSRSTDPLVQDDDGTFRTTLALDPGRYEYKFYVDGEEVLDPTNPHRVPNGFGDFNNVVEIAPRHAETLALHPLGVEDGAAHFAFEVDGEPAEVAPSDIVALLGNRVLDGATASGDRLAVPIPDGATGTLRTAVRRGGQATRLVPISLRDGALDDGFAWQDAVIYQIMVDRFRDGNPANTRPVAHDSVAARANFHGGDLQGILDKVRDGYFERLGINAFWLSPVVQNTERAHREFPPPHRFYTGYHGYWPTDPTSVDERFGDMALLQTLVRESQARGIRVLLDFVANHTHEDHPFVRDHPEWFGTLELPDGRKNLRLWDEQRLTTWFEPYLPSFDFVGSAEAVEAMTDNAVWWLRESGADGFRHDAVKHIPNRFWRTLTRKIREEVDPERVAAGRAPVYQIGETFGSYDLISSYVHPGQLDAQFNFNLYDAALFAFLDAEASFAALDAEMHRTLDVYGLDHRMGNLMDSHDKPRFPALVEGAIPPGANDQEIGWQTDIQITQPETTFPRVALYQAYLLTIPGVPTVYYGNEIGMTGANDPDNRRPMRFGDELDAFERAHIDTVAELVRLRRERPALRRGHFHTVAAEPDVWAYLRAAADDRVLVVLNKGAEPVERTLVLPAAFAPSEATDLLSGEAVAVEAGAVRLSVPAGGYRIVGLR